MSFPRVTTIIDSLNPFPSPPIFISFIHHLAPAPIPNPQFPPTRARSGDCAVAAVRLILRHRHVSELGRSRHTRARAGDQLCAPKQAELENGLVRCVWSAAAGKSDSVFALHTRFIVFVLCSRDLLMNQIFVCMCLPTARGILFLDVSFPVFSLLHLFVHSFLFRFRRSASRPPAPRPTPEDIKKFVDDYPQFRALQTNACKHMALAVEINRKIDARRLLEVRVRVRVCARAVGDVGNTRILTSTR